MDERAAAAAATNLVSTNPSKPVEEPLKIHRKFTENETQRTKDENQE